LITIFLKICIAHFDNTILQMNSNVAKDLIMANSRLVALYKRALEDLANSDSVISRLAIRISELEKKMLCSLCETEIDDRFLCYHCDNNSNKSDKAGYPIRSSARDDDFDSGEVKTAECPSVDLFGNVVEESVTEPEWVNDTTSMWKWPNTQTDIIRDPLDAIGEAQDRYYASLITPISSPCTKTTPPKLERSKRLHSKIHPELCNCCECRYT